MADDINWMDIREFWESGYLQEAKRLFFHPLGLALAITADENGEVSLAGIHDYRSDPVGITFGEMPPHAAERATKVQQLLQSHMINRMRCFGWMSYIQPIGMPIKVEPVVATEADPRTVAAAAAIIDLEVA